MSTNDVYIYQAAIYCNECGQKIIDDLTKKKKSPATMAFVTTDGYRLHATDDHKQWTDGDLSFDEREGWPVDDQGEALDGHFEPLLPLNESLFDSDDFPKGPYPDGGGEADSYQHCDSCHKFLANSLTSHGIAAALEALEHHYLGDRGDESVLDLWADDLGAYSLDKDDQAILDKYQLCRKAARPYEYTWSTTTPRIPGMYFFKHPTKPMQVVIVDATGRHIMVDPHTHQVEANTINLETHQYTSLAGGQWARLKFPKNPS